MGLKPLSVAGLAPKQTDLAAIGDQVQSLEAGLGGCCRLTTQKGVMPMLEQLDHVILFVDDMERSLQVQSRQARNPT